MKRFSMILVAGLNKARKRPVALLVCAALLVAAADLALMAAHRFRQPAYRASRHDAARPLHLDAPSASAADYPLQAEPTGSLPMIGWIDFPLRWPRFALPFGTEEGGRTDLRQCFADLPSR
jgi:hypothetical protein